MARFQVYRMESDRTLAIDLQTNLLDGLQSRVVAPLVPTGDVASLVHRLNPRFEINGETYVMMTEFLASVPARELHGPVADLSTKADTIIAATDFLFQGF